MSDISSKVISIIVDKLNVEESEVTTPGGTKFFASLLWCVWGALPPEKALLLFMKI